MRSLKGLMEIFSGQSQQGRKMYNNKCDVEPRSHRVTAQTRNLVELVLVEPNFWTFRIYTGAIAFFMSDTLLIRPAKLIHLICVKISSLRHEVGTNFTFMLYRVS